MCDVLCALCCTCVVSLMVTGYKRDVEEADLWLLPPREQIEFLMSTFEELWAQEQSRCERNNRYTPISH